jgi:2-polyprenyl-3-methyl-5-hydroxy-6-metoxy-1,4-benzoquinol methylase
MYGSCLLTDTFNRHLGERQAQDFSVCRLKNENYIAHPTVAYRRNLPVRYRNGLRYIDDWYFYLDCIVAGVKIEGIIQTLGVYRVTHEGLTLKDGYLPKNKQRLRNKLIKEFKYLEEDLSDKLYRKPLQQARIKALLKEIPKGSTVADMGCNGGYILEKLRRKRCKPFGVEISKYLVDICRKKNLAVTEDDISKVKLPKIFDRVILGDVLEHFQPKEVKEILLNALKGLRRNGKMIITVPYKHGAYAAQHVKEHVKDYELKDFKEMIPNKMKAKYITYGECVIPLWMLVVVDT